MSNSIYNGTFVLGDVSATTLSAGNGIKITTDEPGVIKVSNDETVLWSGNYTPGNGTAPSDVSVQLTESIMNFERIQISIMGKVGRVIEILPSEVTTTVDAFNKSIYLTGIDSVNNTTIVGLLISTVENNSTKLRFRAGYSSNWADAYRSGKDWGYFTLIKISGINRISGNA